MKLLGILGILIAATVASPNLVPAQSARATSVARSAPGSGQRENRWRYVWHNDRWWFWTANDRWNYFDGRRWVNYDPRRPSTGALAAGYRKAPAFESPPAAPPRPPMSLPGEGIEREAGLVDLFDLGGTGEGAGLRFGGGALPAVSGGGASGTGAVDRAGGAIGDRTGGTGPMLGGAGTGTTGGGGFGGPKGGSLGAGSAAGGASSPR